jgi:hypothetical protein
MCFIAATCDTIVCVPRRSVSASASSSRGPSFSASPDAESRMGGSGFFI